jgi:hypothetical protein
LKPIGNPPQIRLIWCLNGRFGLKDVALIEQPAGRQKAKSGQGIRLAL